MDIFSTITAAGVASLIFSLINCLFGFRLQKFWVGLVCFLFGGVLVVKLTRPAIILLTAATGGFSAAKSVFLLLGLDAQAGSGMFWAMAAVGLAAAVLGAVFQFRSTKA